MTTVIKTLAKGKVALPRDWQLQKVAITPIVGGVRSERDVTQSPSAYEELNPADIHMRLKVLLLFSH